MFVSPSAIYDQLKVGRVLTKQRYATKVAGTLSDSEDISEAHFQMLFLLFFVFIVLGLCLTAHQHFIYAVTFAQLALI